MLAFARVHREQKLRIVEARTAAFMLLAFCAWANGPNVRSETRFVLSRPVGSVARARPTSG